MSTDVAGSSPDVAEVDFNHMGGPYPAGTYFQMYDELRAKHASFRSTDSQGYWVMTTYDNILGTLQRPDVFSSAAIVVTDPNPPYLWIPEMLDAPAHGKWRTLLGPFFSPARVATMEARMRQLCAELVDDCAKRQSIDFLTDFASRFPTQIFLELMGLPIEDTDRFLAWEAVILQGNAELDPDRSKAMAAMMEVMGYFAELLELRRREPRDDLISAAVTWQIDGTPISDGELQSFCLLMFMAGLDTVAMQLCWTWLHLASHPEDRQRIVAEPELIPDAVEEFLRVFAFVLPARKVTEDIEWNGCPMKAGDMVLLPLNSSNRDDAEFDSATTVELDRAPRRHLAFGAGPHRCLGSHLARQQLIVAMREWHRRIPDYHLTPGETVVEHGGQLGVDSLPLTVNPEPA